MIDPRSPRLGAGITAALLLITILLGIALDPAPGSGLLDRVLQPAFLLLTAISLLFLRGATAGVARHPYGLLFRALVRPRLGPPKELEDPRPPTFAQLVGFVVTAAGLVAAALGIPYAVPVAAGAAFVAAFLNAVFGYCIGCQLYLLLVRLRPTGRAA
ncbi:DUF4395 domain-containing protein [Herbiconiux sp.]|uniref:DUF4395 domain-containing protein n=1 Tax=Herbiconiux sp. TaxID=1871186 RepID=UPI0025C72024|nr:DUF4395 domain-containing protein [Herbiconiux sp.]